MNDDQDQLLDKLKIRMLIIHNGMCGTRLSDRLDSSCLAKCVRSDITAFICENMDGLLSSELITIAELEPGHVYETGGGAFATYRIEMVGGQDAVDEYRNMLEVYEEVRHFNGQ